MKISMLATELNLNNSSRESTLILSNRLTFPSNRILISNANLFFFGNKYFIAFILSLASFLMSCDDKNSESDAYGNFEADEIIISAENSGRLIQFDIQEGNYLPKNSIVGIIDTIQLDLKRAQLRAAKLSVQSKFKGIVAQADVVKDQIAFAQIDQKRIKAMLDKQAATQKQMDDINARISYLNKEIDKIESQNTPLFAELNNFDVQIEQVNDLIRRSTILNPIDGTVLECFVDQFELVNPGKPLYKIANIDNIYLKAYISGDQLSQLKLGSKVTVLTDKEANAYDKHSGTVTWISSKAEFTPKIIQTKQERVNLVYAVRIMVKNNGKIKIGMPGEVIF